MKPVFLVTFLCGAIFAPFVLLAEEPDDVEDLFYQDLREAGETVAEFSKKLMDELTRAKETGDYTAAAAASDDLDGGYRRLAPSKLDMWEARDRLIDLIHDSDDETATMLYVLTRETLRRQRELGEWLERYDAWLDRQEEILPAQLAASLSTIQKTYDLEGCERVFAYFTVFCKGLRRHLDVLTHRMIEGAS